MTAPIRLSVPGVELLPRERLFAPPDEVTEPLPVLTPAVYQPRVLDETRLFDQRAFFDHPAPTGQTAVGSLPAPTTRSLTVGRVTQVIAVTVAKTITWCQVSLAAMAVVLGSMAGQPPVLIEGNSMQPSMEPGDVVVLESVDESKPMVGRVVTFTNEKGRVTHRIIDQPDSGEYVTQGDASAEADAEAKSAGDFIGAAKAVVPKVGMPMIWFRQGRFALFGTWLVLTLATAGIAVTGAQRGKRR